MKHTNLCFLVEYLLVCPMTVSPASRSSSIAFPPVMPPQVASLCSPGTVHASTVSCLLQVFTTYLALTLNCGFHEGRVDVSFNSVSLTLMARTAIR